MHQIAIQSPTLTIYLNAFMHQSTSPLPIPPVKKPNRSIGSPNTVSNGFTHPQTQTIHRKALGIRIHRKTAWIQLTQLRTHPLVRIQTKTQSFFAQRAARFFCS